MAVNWAERVSAFSRSPSHFLSGTTAEAFLDELLRELRDDRATYTVKVLLLSPLCEHPTLLCPSESVGEETALELMSVLAQCPAKWAQFRCHLLLALTSVLVCTSCVSRRSPATQDFLDLLLQASQDAGEPHGHGAAHSLRAAACDCLRELEACSPGLLSQHLELLGGLRQREVSAFHQAYTGLYALVLRNAVYQLTRESGAGAAQLRALLEGNTAAAWEADQDRAPAAGPDPAVLSSLVQGPMGSVPVLQTGPDCKELRSVLSCLLEESYLLTPPCQAALLHRLTELVAMVPGVPPAIFRAQLLRLLGTNKVCLLHATLLMKCMFTDSLFSAEDEAFLLKRLVVLAQHPLLAAPVGLFYLDAILHFPENRPLGCGEEAPPVLLTPRLASVLLPTVFNDAATMLARLNLMCLVYQEEGEGEEGEEGEGEGLAYLYQHLASLLRVLENGGGGGVESAVAFFRAALLFLTYFHHLERFSAGLIQKLCQLYRGHAHLAPHLLNLADRAQEALPESDWARRLLTALQGVVTEGPAHRPRLRSLPWHLKVLARVAEEGKVPQRGTLGFLWGVVAPPSSPLCASGDWRLGNGVLAVCRRLLVHPGLDPLLVPLADVLQELALGHGDPDVRDRARLYYALLTTLSGEKLARVLEQGADEAGQQAKRRTLSSIVAESEGLTSALTVHQTGAVTFSLVEAEQEPRATADGGEDDRNGSDPGPDAAGPALDVYRSQFDDPAFAAEIALAYKLVPAQPLPARFHRLFSIHLRFSLTDEHYEELGDVRVPCLFAERPPPPVRLRLRPRRPRPTALRAAAIFATQDGLTWHTALPDVHVAFRQLFLPLPAPPAWGRQRKLEVFEGLWTELRSEGGDSAASLFCCQLGEEALFSVAEKHFLPFLISDVAPKEELKVLFYLPPQSHVLLKIRAEEDAVHFDIATDSWKLLPHINSYLLSITSSETDTHS